MGLCEFEKAEERERRKVNLDCLHSLATRLRADLLSLPALAEPSADTDGVDGADNCAGAEVADSGADSKELAAKAIVAAEDRAKAAAAAENAFGQYLDGVYGFKLLCTELGITPGDFDALALAFCCGSADAQSLSSRQGFLGQLASQSCSSMDALQDLARSMGKRACSQECVSEFWDWLFRVFSSTSGPGDNSRASKKPRLYERPSMPVARPSIPTGVAASALRTVAPCLGSPQLLPSLVKYLTRREPQLPSLSRDTWQMMRVFLQRFPTPGSLEGYDDGDGEFPCLLDSFVEDVKSSRTVEESRKDSSAVHLANLTIESLPDEVVAKCFP